LESPHFEGLTEPGAVQRSARKLLDLVNGAAALVDPSYRPVVLMNRFRDDAGQNFVLASANLTARSRLAVATAEVRGPDGKVVPPPPPPPTLGPEYMAAASRDPNVREVLDVLSDGPGDWVELYKVFEVIRDDGKPTKWAAEADYSAFRASANLPSVSGADARHARRSSGNPKRTMSIHEARDFIRKVSIAWIRLK
jgi:hypothetical protein